MIGRTGKTGYLGLSGGSRLLYPSYVQDYLDRVTAADVTAGNTQGLERGVTDAFNACLQAMVTNGSLGVSGGVLAQAASIIKAACFMMGARTLSGALVPIAPDMPAPTNFNFVGLDFNRKTGLKGDGSTKYLNSNRNNNVDPQNSFSVGVWISSAGTPSDSTQLYLGNAASAMVSLGIASSQLVSRNRSTSVSVFGTSTAVGFFGTNRSSSASYIARFFNANTTINQVSQTPSASDIFIFTESTASAFRSNACLAFYSIGESLNLALLDARVTALINDIAAAIP